MVWLLLIPAACVYAILVVIAVLLIPAGIAKPPWHTPRPGKKLSTKKLPQCWRGMCDPSEAGLSFRDVSFPTYSSLTLRAWLVPAQKINGLPDSPLSNPSPIAIACVHGGGRDRRAFLRHSSFLANAGYDVLLFDCSNHGVSDSVPRWPFGPWPGRAVSLGKREYLDVIAAVNFLTKRGAKAVAVLGTSQGASSAIIAAPQCHAIKLLILENPYASPAVLIRHVVETILSKFPVPFFHSLLAAPITWISLFRTGNMLANAQQRAIDYVTDVKVPMFFIHGTADMLVNYQQSQGLHEKATCADKDIWLVEGASHTQCYDREPREFQTRVLTFLRHHLISERPTDRRSL